ncbi:peptidase M8 leishmanolysin family protein [Gemmatirosa kalamazoonensis]|uniref:Peptidase M8 leishmanolysin family protein n=1 Tax=Gemmatirosa kalamazoonensis TaxID=861299 RepID=W0RIJ5_9BACT|nr:Ig-like domain-containing protein [Gemmatirosa kalamazoonensis]AHG89208.1 peptidase M8 leishmanolysin family protein [Gemmatirosa kalamazoonensis]
MLAACGGGGDGTTATKAPELASIAIVQRLDTLSELESRTLTLSGLDTKGQPMTVKSATWTSSDTTVAVVSTAGEVTGVRPGSATITAASGAASASLPIRIVSVPVRDVSVRLVGGVASDTLVVGTSAQLVAEARDIAGRVLLGRQVSVSLADPTKATLDAGKLSGLAVGLVDVVAKSDSIQRRRTIVVRPTFAAKIALRLLDPKKLGDTTWAGLKDSALVTFTDSAGQALASSPFRPISYSSDNPAVVQVDPYGKVQFLGAGTATIRASGERLVAAKQIVAVRAPVTAVIAAPDTVRVLPGETSTLRPILVDGGGLRTTSLAGHTLSYTSLAPSVATVNANGEVKGVSVGAAQVQITSDRGKALVPVKVLGAPKNGAFHITIKYLGPTPAQEVQDAFAAAKARWERIIRESTDTLVFSWRDGDCDDDVKAHTDTIPDVMILARIDSIDGPSNILGQAGPCLLKVMDNGRRMSSVGVMQFDSSDMRLMITQNKLVNVITHEMGHVLGFGTLWASRYNNGVALSQSGFTYSGAGAVSASAGMGFTNFTIGATGDPTLDRALLEDTGGPGTAGSHWRRSVYGNELMNGFAGSGAQPLSLLTLMAISDLGYEVNTGAAEPWGSFIISTNVTTASSALANVLGYGSIRLEERQFVPELEVSRRGTSRRQLSASGSQRMQ